jgi:hypothetical protein
MATLARNKHEIARAHSRRKRQGLAAGTAAFGTDKFNCHVVSLGFSEANFVIKLHDQPQSKPSAPTQLATIRHLPPYFSLDTLRHVTLM